MSYKLNNECQSWKCNHMPAISYILLISKCSFLPLQKLYRGPHVSWHTHLIAATHNNTLSLHIWIRHTQHTINPPALGDRLLAVTWSKVSAGDSFALEINVHHTQNHCVLLLLDTRLPLSLGYNFTHRTHTHHCLDTTVWIHLHIPGLISDSNYAVYKTTGTILVTVANCFGYCGVSKKGEIQMEYRQKCDEENWSVTKQLSQE